MLDPMMMKKLPESRLLVQSIYRSTVVSDVAESSEMVNLEGHE
jgi:hypothetical protein